jgi:hypothetical protein
MNYPRGLPRGIQQPEEKAYAASRGESDPTRLKEASRRTMFGYSLSKQTGL